MFLFRDLATFRTDPPVLASIDDLEWRGPTADFPDICARVEGDRLLERVNALTP